MLAILGNIYFYTIDPLISLYAKIKVKIKKWVRNRNVINDKEYESLQ